MLIVCSLICDLGLGLGLVMTGLGLDLGLTLSGLGLGIGLMSSWPR